MKTQSSQKKKHLKIELPYDAEIPILGIYLKKKRKTLIQKDTCTPMFTAALFTIVKIQKQPMCPSTDEYTHTQWNTIKPQKRKKKNENFAICSNMDGLGGYYAKWNKSDGEGQMLYDITYMWNLKNKTN